MPKKPNAKLEENILNAAYRLWVEGGEPALTMRAVARAAGTTTPTLYERFQDKKALLSALQARAQQSLFEAIKPSRSIQEACQIALDYATERGHEYELMTKNWAARLSGNGPTPAFDLVKERLAEQLGGSPEDHFQLALGIVTLYHGASVLLLGKGIHPKTGTAIKDACVAAVDSLLASAEKTTSRKRAAD